MKLTRRILALMLCLTMVLALGIPVFAAEHTHVITINNSHDDYEYVAYQIFDGDLDKTGTLSNITWGDGVDGAGLLAYLKANYPTEFGTANDAEDVATVLAKQSGYDNSYAQTFAHYAADYVIEAKGIKSVDAGSNYTITVPSDGYYLVINTKVPTDEPNTTYSRYILEVVADVEVKHKGTFPTVEKDIVEDGNRVNINEASIGDEITYEITGSLPSNLADYDTYYYVFTDTLSKGLTYKPETLVVTVNGVPVTDYFYKGATAWSETTGTTITIGIKDLLALELLPESGKTEPVVGEITKDSKVVVTYKAVLNEYAEIGVNGNPNVVDLEYSNNPNVDGDGSTMPPPNPDKPVPEYPTGKTPEKEVISYVTELLLKKVDGTGATLTGAEFTLTGEGVNWVIITGDYYKKVEEGTGTHWLLNDGTYITTPYCDVDDPATTDKNEDNSAAYKESKANYVLVEDEVTVKTETGVVKAKAFVDENGLLKFTGLGAGTYTLTETVTPAGFNTCDPITFTITFDPETAKFQKDNASDVLFDETTSTYHITVKNVAGSKLPSTGGIGTTLFYVFGSVLFVGAAVLLITKKRMSA